jgi:hypothetical protein
MLLDGLLLVFRRIGLPNPEGDGTMNRETSGTVHPVTQCHISQDLNFVFVFITMCKSFRNLCISPTAEVCEDTIMKPLILCSFLRYLCTFHLIV